MLLIIPNYYRKFQCIADKCKDSCCVGWEIDIDEETYEFYSEVQGDFGKRLKENIKVGKEDICFILNGERCPFLNDKNLCDIYTELGDTSLCEVCMEYPRFTIEYGNFREKCLGLSCEAAGELIFAEEAPVTFEYIEIPEEYVMDEEDYVICDGDEEGYVTCDEENDLEYDIEEEEELGEWLRKARDYAITILQTREISLRYRIATYLLFCHEIQEVLDHDDIEIIDEKIEQFKDWENNKKLLASIKPFEEQELYLAFGQRMQVFTKMEILDHEWKDYSKKMYRTFFGVDVKSHEYVDYLHTFDAYYSKREFEYEHLMVYFTFRYFMKSVYDRNFLGKAKFAVASYLLIHDMDALRFLENEGEFTKADRIDVARIFSKEVEHSEDNLEMLAGEFIAQQVFEVDKLISQILG